MARPRVVLVRGHQANSWHLRPWQHLTARFDVVAIRTRGNWFDTGSLGFTVKEARALRDVFPRGAVFDQLARVPGDRYLQPRSIFAGAAIVHSQDLGFWYSMQAARLKRALGFKLVLTCWETIPFHDAYRNVRTRRYRSLTLAQTDLFLATTERARDCLLLEGAPSERVAVCPPGVDHAFFERDVDGAGVSEHLVVSAGRLVWEKGHQDLIRACALLRRRGVLAPRMLIIGAGPERQRLLAYARELGVDDLLELRTEVPYDQMPGIYSRASALVLASLPVWFWEEQFGMVLVEALSAGLPVLASMSGAIPEVVGDDATLFAPGDWVGLAHALADGPLSQPPGARRQADPERVARYSSEAAAERLAAHYEALVSAP